MERPLHALLESHSVDRRIVEWMEDPRQKCWTLKVFANWANYKKDLFEDIDRTILDHTACRGSRYHRCLLVQAWKEADRYAARVVEQAAEDSGNDASKPQSSDTRLGVEPEAIQRGQHLGTAHQRGTQKSVQDRVPRASRVRPHAFRRASGQGCT